MKSPAFSMYVRDALASPRIAEMPLAEVGAYNLLLWCAWLQVPRASLPNNDAVLMRLARANYDEWREFGEHLKSMFDLGPDGRLYSQRLSEVSHQQERNVQNGGGGWNKKRRQNTAKNLPKRDAKRDAKQPAPSETPSTP